MNDSSESEKSTRPHLRKHHLEWMGLTVVVWFPHNIKIPLFINLIKGRNIEAIEYL